VLNSVVPLWLVVAVSVQVVSYTVVDRTTEVFCGAVLLEVATGPIVAVELAVTVELTTDVIVDSVE